MPDPGTQFHDSSFWLIRLTGRPFVDKSGFIEELLSRPPARITRITRPAGFGKTVNLNMLRDFLDIRMDNSRFFDGLRVLQNAGLCKKWMHRYPVIWLPLELLHEQGPDPVFHSFRRIASDLVIDHSYLLESPGVDRFHRLRLASICDMLASKVRLASTLRYLVRALSDHWGRKVVLLVDDADKPFACAESEGYRHALTSFLRELFAGALEENGLAFAVLAGSLGFDCPERSMFCSHGEENCGIRDEGFESCFGFTQAEVADLLAGAGLAGREADLGAWCGGYHVGRESCLHNAREVMFSLHVLGQQADAEPETGPGADLGTEPCAGIDAATGTGRSAGPDTGSGTGAGTESRAALTPLCHPDWRNRAMRRALAAALAGRNSREKISDYLEKLLAGGETGFRFHGLTWKEAAGSRGSLFGALLHCGWLGQSREPARWGPKEAVYVTVPNGAARRELAAMLREVRAEPAAKGREEALCPAGQGCKWPDSSPDTSPD
ncbi:MAG: AAA family ATPase, partial [Desulfovibrionaceae bacterium]|nr:AAA family ATPase [Desulfovibrionaceae bacterium]